MHLVRLKCAHVPVVSGCVFLDKTQKWIHTLSHVPPQFDPGLVLQLPETQQKASSIHCMSCVFPRRAPAQQEKGPRSLSPDMDVYSLYGPAEHPQKDWPEHFDVRDI